MNIFETKQSYSLGNFNFKLSFGLNHFKKGIAIGSYSICQDGKHCIYLDYDNFRYEWLISELKEFQKKYKLSEFYVLRSSQLEIGKYKHHAVCFDKLNAREYNLIVRESNADILFRNNGIFDLQNSRVLRTSAKTNSTIMTPVFHSVINSKCNTRPKSQAHINFYTAMFNIPETMVNRKNQDEYKQINIIKYETKNL